MSVEEEELLEEISGYLHGYLKSGKVRMDSFISKINVNIANFEQLLTIRFLLLERTMDFARVLPTLLKRFKTNTITQSETHIGEVRGQIHWEQTIKERLGRNSKDRTIFSANESVRSYNISENLVLKELLGILYHILFQNSFIKGFEKAPWFSEWQQLKDNISHSFHKNIYLQRVETVHVSDRVLQKTLNHRNRLYRDAAELLLNYRNLMNGYYSKEDLQELLRQTFIAPDNKDVLFELFWVVQIIKQNTEQSKLHLMDGSHNMVATWETEENDYYLYHDSTGSNEVQFRVSEEEISKSDNEYLNQKYKSFKVSNQLVNETFGQAPSLFYWRGRPDFLIEVYEKGSKKLVKLFVGEVKNTASPAYARRGFEELLEYIYLAKDRHGEYLVNHQNVVKGMLCLGDVPVNNREPSEVVKIIKKEKGLVENSVRVDV